MAAMAFASASLLPSAGLAQETPAVAAIYEKAKAEGAVNSEGAWSQEQMQPLIEAFEARYPGVKVSYVNKAPDAQTVAALITEIEAGSSTLDVTGSAPTFLLPLMDRDLVLAYPDWGNLGLAPEMVKYDGRFLYLHDSVFVLAYNTDLVTPEEAPRQWKDLLDPKWKDGALILDSRGLFLSPLAVERGLGMDSVIEIASGLKEQNPLFVTRGSLALDRLSAGEGSIASVSLTFLLGRIAQGAPVAVAPVSPQANFPFGHAILKSGKHQNAAILWVSWLASPEARKIVDAQGIGFATPCGDTRGGKLLCDAKIELVTLESPEDVATSIEAFGKVTAALGTQAK